MQLKTGFMHINPIVSILFFACFGMGTAYAESIQCTAAQQTNRFKTLCVKDLEQNRQLLNEKYLTAFLITDAPVRLIQDTQRLWLDQVTQCKSLNCYKRQFDLRLEDLNFYTSMNQSLTQHFVKYEHGSMAKAATQLQVHQLSKDRIKIEGISYRNPKDSAIRRLGRFSLATG